MNVMTCESSEKTPLWLSHGSVRITSWMKVVGPWEDSGWGMAGVHLQLEFQPAWGFIEDKDGKRLHKWVAPWFQTGSWLLNVLSFRRRSANENLCIWAMFETPVGWWLVLWFYYPLCIYIFRSIIIITPITRSATWFPPYLLWCFWLELYITWTSSSCAYIYTHSISKSSLGITALNQPVLSWPAFAY
jgi:hypothetical protein